MIKLNNVEKVYNKGSQTNSCLALSNINLEFPDKGLFFISGRSGCGKTTLLNILSGLDKPTAGEVINNYDTVNFYSIIFQDYQLIDYLTVRENILLASLTDEIMDVCNECQISDILDHYPNQISGGQKQRVAIVRTLMMDPEIILFDEPTSALDPEMIGEVTNLMRKIAKEGMTMLIVSHEMNFIKNFCTRVVFLSDGVVKEEGTSKEIFEHPKDEKLKTFLSKINNY